MKLRTGVVSVLAVLVLVTGTVLLIRSMPHSATIGQVTGSPKKYSSVVVRVTGTVSLESPAVGGFRVFRLADETGSLWVLTKLAPPAEGSLICVQGQVNVPLSYGPVGLGTYLVEDEREVVEE